jgi:hypothetical protein
MPELDDPKKYLREYAHSLSLSNVWKNRGSRNRRKTPEEKETDEEIKKEGRN